jgi:hypothetical protein
LIVLSEWPEDVEAEEKNRTCLRVSVNGENRKAVEVVGTFKKGFLGEVFQLIFSLALILILLLL